MEALELRYKEVGFSPSESKRLASLEKQPFSGKTGPQMKDWLTKTARLYSCTENEIRNSILTHPQFAGLDHSRVVSQAVDVYGKENEERVKKAVLSFPPFAGYDHSRVVREKSRLGRLLGLKKEKVMGYLLEKPVLASYSAKHNLATINAARTALSEMNRQPTDSDFQSLFDVYLRNYASTPYVGGEGFSRTRINQARKSGRRFEDPKMLGVFRKALNPR